MNTIFVPVLLFTLSMTGTPGPNNMLLTASGARFGYRRTLPLIAGIVVGLTILLTLSALGLGVLFGRIPGMRLVLKVSGTVYMISLACKIAFGGSSRKGTRSAERPFFFLQGVGLQFLNPKAYVMTITAMAVYPLSGSLYAPSAGLIIGTFLVITPVMISLWAGFGTLLGNLLRSSRYANVINLGLGALTAASVVFILI